MASLPGALEGTRPVPYPWQQVEGATRSKLRPWLGWSPVLSLRKVISQHPNGPAGDGQPGLGGLVQPWLVQAASTRSLSSSALSCWEGSQLTSLKFPLRQISRRNLPCKFLLSVCRWATSSLSSVSRSESLTLCSASKPRTLAATSVCTSEAGSHALWSGTYASSGPGSSESPTGCSLPDTWVPSTSVTCCTSREDVNSANWCRWFSSNCVQTQALPSRAGCWGPVPTGKELPEGRVSGCCCDQP